MAKLTKKVLDRREEQWRIDCADRLKDLVVLSDFTGFSGRMRFLCLKCGHEFETTAYELKRHKSGNCHWCDANARTKTEQDFIDEVKRKNKHFDNFKIGPYVNKRTRVDVECLVCGHKWKTLPGVLYSGANCPKCNKGRLKTHEQFCDELRGVNKDVEVLETYINDSTKILVKCKKCGHEWRIKPNTLLNGHGCPKCKIRHLEREVCNALDDKIEYEFQKTFGWLKTSRNGIMKLDIYIPSINIAIECQGAQHFRPVNFSGRGDEFSNECFLHGLENDIKKHIKCDEHGIEVLYFTSNQIAEETNFDDERYNGLYRNVFTDINKLVEYIYEKKNNLINRE